MLFWVCACACVRACSPQPSRAHIRDALLPFQGAIDVMSKVARLNTPADKLHHIYLASKEIERCMPASEECVHQDPHQFPHVTDLLTDELLGRTGRAKA